MIFLSPLYKIFSQVFVWIILTSTFSLPILAQDPTIGLLEVNSSVTDGYTLFTPEKNNDVYLINNCGEKINEWNFTEKPGATCYLLENGTLLRAGKDNLEIRSWDNTVLWTYAMNTNGLLQHHDIEPLPNGNILCIITDKYNRDEMIAIGRNPSLLSDNLDFKFDKIVELQPVGADDANIVWEWKFYDHLIQEFDNSKPNFGNVIDHPELLDLNFDNGEMVDFTHLNGIDYNANLDQIIISSRNLSEIYIIDHSTTTTEAASHSGGNSIKGGDFLWRWGNPQVYQQGTTADQKLLHQHDSKWVETGYLDEGKISVFNNGGDGTATFSSVHLITPVIEANEYTMLNNTFLPTDYFWSWNGSIQGHVVLEPIKSGCHALPNGNMMICEYSYGNISEITKSGNVLWTYKNPTGSVIYNQNDEILSRDNALFRGEKYPVDYIGFDGNDMTPSGIIEDENSVSATCISNLNTQDLQINQISIYNPISQQTLVFSQYVLLENIAIYDLSGKLVYEKAHFEGQELPINLKPSMYFVKVNQQGILKNFKVIVP